MANTSIIVVSAHLVKQIQSFLDTVLKEFDQAELDLLLEDAEVSGEELIKFMQVKKGD